MKKINKLFNQSLLCWPIILSLLVVTEITARATGIEIKDAAQTEVATPSVDSNKNYSGLTDLITTVCDEALEQFQDFYGSSVIMVEPFATIGHFEQNKQSELGSILADQMIAVMNTNALRTKGLAFGTTPQKLNGALQEVDGYLRIHLRGINAAGKRASYVISVEMSEPIYRSLHTYL